MARLRYNGLSAVSADALTSGETTITFAAALTHSGGTAVPTIASPNHLPLSILDVDGRLAEIVHLTAYTSGATTGTIVRGREGTTGVAHDTGVAFVHAPSVLDVANPWEAEIALRAPVHRWKFNEASGSSVADSVGSLNLTMSGTYTRAAAGPFGAGGATTFTSAAEAVSSGLGSIPTGTADKTIVVLFRTTSLTSMALCGYGNNAALELFFPTLNDSGVGFENGTFICHLGGSLGVTQVRHLRTVALSDGRWHMAVVSMYSAGKVRSNGIDDSEAAGVFPAVSTGTAGNFVVGNARSGSTFPFVGDIADVNVFNYALSRRQILDLYRAMTNSLA